MMFAKRASLDWAAPATVTAILLITVAGLLAPLVSRVDLNDAFTERLLPSIFGIVGIASVLQLRLIVLPGLFKSTESAGSAVPSEPFADVERTAVGIACAFSISDAIYGVATTVMLDQSLWALPFGALGLVSLAINLPFVRGRLDDVYRQRAARGET